MKKQLSKILLVTLVLSICVFAKSKNEDASPGHLPPIEVHGNKFFNSETGEQFFMKGIAYQPSTAESIEHMDSASGTKYIDPMASPDICLRDLPYLVKLGVNTVRVYSVDPTSNHDACMDAFAKKGIYVLFDLSEPDVSIAREAPTWDITIFERYKSVVDSVGSYTNTLGFFAGNEVTTDKTNTQASSFVKASIRDIKKHIREHKNMPRKIPVGYSSNDDPDVRDQLAAYFVCDADNNNNVDFFGINMYEWCGYSSYVGSGYRERTLEFKNYPVPVFFSEFGCNEVRPRPFTEVEALFSPLMTKVWSGGLVYMYFEEKNQYGVVSVDSENGDVKELSDFKYLQEEYNKAKPKGVMKDFINEKGDAYQARQCPAISDMWVSTSDLLPPTPNPDKCACLTKMAPCVVGQKLPTNKDYGNLFEYLCGKVDCSPISSSKNVYGEYSDCSLDQKLTYVVSKYYHSLNFQKKNIGECPQITSGKFPSIYFNELHKNSFVSCEVYSNQLKENFDQHDDATTTSKNKSGTSAKPRSSSSSPDDGKKYKKKNKDEKMLNAGIGLCKNTKYLKKMVIISLFTALLGAYLIYI
ncbi:hypothetical protein ACO0QE_003072 [Hanseniaspora vineae]